MKTNTVDAMIDYEMGLSDPDDTIDLFSHLKQTGILDGLQGGYHRMFRWLVDNAYLDEDGNILGYYG